METSKTSAGLKRRVNVMLLGILCDQVNGKMTDAMWYLETLDRKLTADMQTSNKGTKSSMISKVA